MASTNSSTPSNNNQIAIAGGGGDASAAADSAAKSVQKRYEGLAMVRTKAVKGKGAWYWAHLEPILVSSPETGLPKAVKLRCSLCDAVFSASNPSRTASEHLKRGTCPNFSSSAAATPRPITTVSPSSAAAATHLTNRKRNTAMISAAPAPVLLSGGKEDLGALAILEDRVKKLKSPKASPAAALSRSQVESAVELLADWVYDSYGSVSLSSLEDPKFKAFLQHVGVPAVSARELAGARLEGRFKEARAESEARIRDAMFFQVASEGWKSGGGEESLVNLTVNLPNGTSLYRRAVLVTGKVPWKYAEEVLWETVTGISGSNVGEQCAGIVADGFKSKALRSLEGRNQWMVNLSCQFRGFKALIKDFSKDLPLFTLVRDHCLKLVAFLYSNSILRSTFHKFQLQEYGSASLIRLPLPLSDSFLPSLAMLDDLLSSARALQLLLLDDSFKAAAIDDPNSAREVSEIAADPAFWSRIEAVHSLARLINDAAAEVEAERPLVGQCLPLWEELKAKIKDWCAKFRVNESAVDRIVDRRFRKNYHPAWAAAFILDPVYLTRDASGKYLPPFKCLSAEQEKDVDKLITRLVSREEAHIVLMELMKWRTEGLDPVYARAVQMKERDPVTGKMRITNPQSGRLVWETYLTEFKSLGRVAVRLIFLHATACSGFKCNWSSVMRFVAAAQGNSRAAVEKAQKLVFIAAHSRLERRDFAGDEEKDAQLLALADEEQDDQETLDKHIVARARPP